MRKGVRFYTTVLSLVISTASLISVYSITTTLKKEVQKDVTDMGADILEIDPRYKEKEGGRTRFFTLKDIYLLKTRFRQEIKRIGVIASATEGGSVVDGLVRIIGEKYLPIFEGWSGPFGGTLWGITPELKDIIRLRLKKGRFINITDLKLKRRVCVLGNYIYNQVGGEKIIGKRLELSNYISEDKFQRYTFTVIGGLEKKAVFGIPYLDMFIGSRLLAEDEVNLGVLIPVTTLQAEMQTDSLGNGWVYLQIPQEKQTSQIVKRKYKYGEEGYGEDDNLPKRIKDINKKLITYCKKTYGQEKEFYIGYTGRLVDELEFQTKQINTFIGTIGLMSLIIAIISLLSLMLLSVTEKTSEIGVRRAFGARKKDICRQFLIDGLIITGTGGIVGVIGGIIGVWFIGWYAGWEMIIPCYSIIVSLLMVIVIGILSSIYPAMKAANVPPGEALRWE